MHDPVVASDGNSYERAAIQTVLDSENAISPLTREMLRVDLFVNRNLLNQIKSYTTEMLEIANLALKRKQLASMSASSAERSCGKKRGRV